MTVPSTVQDSKERVMLTLDHPTQDRTFDAALSRLAPAGLDKMLEALNTLERTETDRDWAAGAQGGSNSPVAWPGGTWTGY